MGLFSWFSITASKTRAAVLIEISLEILNEPGLIDVQPKTLANRVVEAAFTRVPNLNNAKYDKHVLAVSILAMAPALPSLSKSEREACKHALGVMVKRVLELQMANSLALTLSEDELIQRAQHAYIASMRSTPAFNLGPSFDETPPMAVDIEKFSRVIDRKAVLIEAANSFECIAAERDYIESAYGKIGSWKLLNQTLVKEDGSVYDKFDIALSDGTKKTIWFDITFSWGKWGDSDSTQ